MSDFQPPYEYMATVTKIVDGDTVYVSLDLGIEISVNLKLRLYGINAPEKRGASRGAGIMALNHLKHLLTKHRLNPDDKIYEADVGQKILIKTRKDKQGKYGRYLAELIGCVRFDDGNREEINLNAQMVIDGHAVEYMKDKK